MQQHLASVLPLLRHEPGRQRVRALLADETVLDTASAQLVREPRRVVPMYAVPVDALHADLVPAEPSPPVDLDRLPPVLGPDHVEPHTTPGTVADVVLGDRRLSRAAYLLEELGGIALLEDPDPLTDAIRARDHVCFCAERSDLDVDGERQPRPVTPWSPPENLAHLADGGAQEFS